MKTRRSAYVVAAAALLGVAGLAAAPAAVAGPHVSFGIALPGVSIGVGQPAPYPYYGPRYYSAPVYAPTYGETGYVAAPVYSAPPVVYAPPPPVYYAPPPPRYYYGRPYYGPRYYRY